jgi:quercetin dioxygenase-like cupin family protein
MRYKIDNIKNYAKTRGWLCGHFFSNGSIQKNSELEVKYDMLNAGDVYPAHHHPHGTEVCIVISGKLKWQLDSRDFILSNGDFIFLKDNVTEAILEVYEPTIVISVRTPSLPNNKIEKNKT